MIEVFEELEKLFTKKFLERIPRVPDKPHFISMHSEILTVRTIYDILELRNI